jgi:DNA-binding response OmpR family regulator
LHILLVEDDMLVASGICAGLRFHGLTVDHAASASRAQAALEASNFDCCILDLGLPDADGMTVLKRWRKGGLSLPVLVLTARDALEHRVAGLQAGADDYLLKPFELAELVARLQALHRRAAGRSSDVIVYGNLTLTEASSEVSVNGCNVQLARRELAILKALLQRPNQILSSEQLRERIYGLDRDVESNAVNVHIYHLRRKLGPDFIETIRGIGYRLKKLTA